MENKKQGTAVLIQDELAPIAILKPRGEKPAPERRQSDPSQGHTPERPRSSLRYNTPMTPDYASRPRAVSYESKASISPSYESDDRSEDDSPPSVPGPGAVKGGPIYIQRRTSFQRPLPPSRKRTHTPRVPSWHSTSKGPVHIITSSLNRITQFMRTVDCSPNTDSTNFKLFLDANKEIVRAWLVLEDEEIKGNPVLGEKVDCMHAILAAWSIGEGGTDPTASWLLQALELAELDREFAGVWEGVVGVEIEKFGEVDRGGIKEEDIFTSPSELAADESKVEDSKVEESKVEEGKMSQTEPVTDEESGIEDAEDISTSPSQPTASRKVEEQQNIPTSPTEPTTDDEPAVHETMEFINPDDFCAPLYPTKHSVGSGSGGNLSTMDGRASPPSKGKVGDTGSSVGSNSPKASHEHDTVSSAILERLDRIEALLQQQSNFDQSQATVEKVESLKELIVQQSVSQATIAAQDCQAIASHIEQATSEATDKITTTLKERFDKIDSDRLEQQQQKSAKQKFSWETLESVIDQHLEKVETRFVGKFDKIQDSIENLSSQHSTTATAFLNELTKLNSKPPPKESDTSNQEHANQASLDDLEKHLSQLNEGISITDRGTMIQQVHLAIFRDWNALRLEQKRSAVSLMKKLVADWQEKYRIKMSLMDAVVTDLKDMPPETVEKVTARTTEVKEKAEKMKADIDLVEECMANYGQFVTLQEELNSKVALLEEKKNELKQAMMNSHWVYTALDEAVDILWPQGDTESSTDTDTDSELECEEGGLGNQLGKKGGGNGGGCVIM